MRFLFPRPVLLALTLVLVVGAIAFIELRLDAASPAAADAGQSPDPSAAEEQDERTPDLAAKKQGETATTPRATNNQDSPERAAGGGPEREISDAERVAEKAEEYERAAEIVNPSGFVNTDGFSVREAAGEKVVLLEFWTYSCFNCQNVQPHVNAWHERYAAEGLQVVGVHSPEFGFEKNYANVEAAVREAGIAYPVVLDNAYATWNAYNNRYWPAMYLIDADGFIRYKHFGEGAYEETEEKIQELLAERNRISG